MLEQSVISSFNISALIALSANAELTEDEQQYLDKWIQKNQHNRDLYTRLTNNELTKQDLILLNSFNTTSAFAKVSAAIKRPSKIKRNIPTYYYLAAAITLVTLTTIFFFNPFKERAVESIAIAKTNTVTTPVGIEQQITLPDGTKVRLSAASTLSYPSSFDNSPYRTVKLIGQAYFEVTRNEAQPFIVKSKLQEIEVVGTSFKVESYLDEPETKTSLYSGVIKIKRANKKDIVLSPGQQSLVSNFAIRITQMDNEGEDLDIHFKSESFQQVVRKIERWYDVDIQYPDHIETNNISGAIAKSGTRNELAGILSALYPDLKVTLNGKTILVEPLK